MAFSTNNLMTSSRLVETIQINFEDFSESFLTCGTCLTVYDSGEHQPKLLPCSHTLCRACLHRILHTAAPGQRPADMFRCPICREGIAVPMGGAAAFPPSFLVNQLLDLMATQRRDIVPKCSVHASQELLFCETCDVIFCSVCQANDVAHSNQSKGDHSVLSFSVAVKRMSEILLYKVHLSTKQLSAAYDCVVQESERLEKNTESCLRSVDESFEDLKGLVEKRHAQVRAHVMRLQDQKRKVLKDQLELIAQEKAKIESQCDGLQYQMDVRAITKKISDLNAKLDTFTLLSEPRENAYIDYNYKSTGLFNVIDNSISDFGCVRVSTTYPGLCSLNLGASPVTVNLRCKARLSTLDYHGKSRTSGGDPVTARLETPRGDYLETHVEDMGDGNYDIHFVPLCAGKHRLTVLIFDRPIRDAPLIVDVAGRQLPAAKAGGSRGSASGQMQAPFAVAVGRCQELYVADTGNCRVVALDKDLRWLGDLGRSAFGGQAGTGLAVDSGGRLWAANWKDRKVYELDPVEDRVVCTLQNTCFREPGLVAIGNRGEVVVGDAGAGSIFVVDPVSPHSVLATIGNGKLKALTALTVNQSSNQLVFAEGAIIKVWDLNSRRLLGQMTSTSAAGVTGMAVDTAGRLVVSRSSGLEVYSKPLGEFVCQIVPEEHERLRRPAGVCTLPQGWLVVADTQGHTVKKFRYL